MHNIIIPWKNAKHYHDLNFTLLANFNYITVLSTVVTIAYKRTSDLWLDQMANARLT